MSTEADYKPKPNESVKASAVKKDDAPKAEAPKTETPAAAPKVEKDETPTPPADAPDTSSADLLKELTQGLASLRDELAATRESQAKTQESVDSLLDGPTTEEDLNPSQPGTLPTLDEELEHHLKAQTPAVIIAAVTGLSSKELRIKAKKLGYELDDSKEGSSQAPPEGGIGINGSDE
jgi:hypothetical protein